MPQVKSSGKPQGGFSRCAQPARRTEVVHNFWATSPGTKFEGISVSKHVIKLGYKGVEAVEKAYSDHRIPAGELGRGLPQILGVLEVGRINIASRAAGLGCDVEAAMTKLFASETALELSMEAMRIHVGVGYTNEMPVERYFRDAPFMVIREGTNEIQQLVIARGLLARARA